MANYQSPYTGEQIDEAVGKASKALVTPDTAPSSVVIPAIGTDNTQTNLTLGDGLNVAGGVISAAGSGGGYTVLAKDAMTLKNVVYADGSKTTSKSLARNDTLNNVVYFEYTATSTAMGVTGAIVAKQYSNTPIYFNVASIQMYIVTPEWNKAYIIPVGNCTLEYSSN